MARTKTTNRPTHNNLPRSKASSHKFLGSSIGAMKAILLNFVFVSLVGALLGVRSRAHELRGGAADVEKQLDEPAAPRWEGEEALRRLRRTPKCQRERNFGDDNPKITKWCRRQCLACDKITVDSRKQACEEEFCNPDNPDNDDTTITLERGCSRSRGSQKLRRFCTATCRWCAEARRCNTHPKKDDKGEGSEACQARQCQAKCRCRFANCPLANDGTPVGVPADDTCGNQNFENCDASPLSLPETAARIEEEFDEEEFFAMAMELGLPGDEEVFDDEESFARAMELAPPGPDGMSMPP